MPELPEVETLRRSIEPAVAGRTVRAVAVFRRDMISGPGDPPGGFSRAAGSPKPVSLQRGWLFEDLTIHGTSRRGKQLALEADREPAGAGPAIIIQLGMTGTITVLDRAGHLLIDDLPAHTHVLWTLDNGVRLAFSDPRRFGLVRAVPDGTAQAWASLGPDALTIPGRVFAGRLAATRRAIKAALLDQAVLAGIGNIYADEALFAAGIHPETRADRIGSERAHALAAAVRRILREAVRRGGSTIRDYRDGSGRSGTYQHVHNVYGRTGEPCRTCGRALVGSRVAQRATVVCPRCQPGH